MKKSFKKLFLLMAVVMTAVVCLTFSVSAAKEGYYTYEVYNGSATITDVDTSISDNVTIPSALGGYSVTEIGDAFMFCKGLTSITIPESVTEIGSNAFYDCTGLKSVTIGKGVTSIGDSAFNGCTSLTSITIPKSVTEIGSAAFANCSSLTSITIPDSVTYIDSYAFDDTGYYNNASNWKNKILYIGNYLIAVKNDISGSCTIKKGVKYIPYSAFSDCTGLTSITIPDSVTCIFSSAFYNCTGLKSVTIGKGVTTIGYSAFENCTSLTNITIPDSVTEIGYYVFYNCTGLKSVTIGKGVTSIGYSAFRDCKSLASITIPNSVTEIAYGAFLGCTGLTTVDFGKGLINLNNEAFKDCVNLTKFSVDKNNKKYSADSNGVLFNKNKTVLIKYPPANKATSYKIPSKVTSIGEGAFSGCSNLKDVTIPDSISTISKNAFVGCTSFKEAVIPNKVTEIAYGAFDNCTGLESVQIPESVESIGMGAFAGCEEMEDVYYEGSEKEWGDISISYNNDYLTSAKIHYNFKPCTHKKLTTLKAVAPTCTKDGKTEGKKCKSCGKITVEQEMVAKKGHTYKTTSGTKATLKKNGKVVKKCTVCGYSKKTTIYYPKSIKLSATSYTYNGKTKKPAVTVKDSKGKTLKKDTDYTVKYEKGRKAIGKYTVTVTFKGKYSGTKKLSFTIKPKAVTLSKVTAGSKQLTANWKTVAAVTGYEVQASTSSKFTSKTTKKVTVKSAKTKKTTIKKLKKGKKYYVKVRAYKTVDGKKIYGGWSKAKSVKIK